MSEQIPFLTIPSYRVASVEPVPRYLIFSTNVEILNKDFLSGAGVSIEQEQN